MSYKEDYIKRYGMEGYEKQQAQCRAWNNEHPEEVIATSNEQKRKGGKYYDKHLEYETTGIPGEKQRIRAKHGIRWNPYKRIIAPESQIHHSWRPGAAEYDGVALVEADAHMHGFIDVIQILKGEITIFTEKELRERGELDD